MENFQQKSEIEPDTGIANDRELVTELPGHRFKAAEGMIEFINENCRAVFECPESRRQYLLDCSYDDFKNLLININAITRGLDSARHEFDGQEAWLLFSALPDWENRQPLLQQALTASKWILSQEARPLPNQLEDLAILWGGTITAVHPFLNGNGRTARILGLLIDQGFDGTSQSDRHIEITMSKAGRSFFCNNPLAVLNIDQMLGQLNDVRQHQPTTGLQGLLQKSFFNKKGRSQEDGQGLIDIKQGSQVLADKSRDIRLEIVSLFIETIVNPDDYIVSVEDFGVSNALYCGYNESQQFSLHALYCQIFENLSFLYAPLSPIQKLDAKEEASTGRLREGQALAKQLEIRRRDTTKMLLRQVERRI